MTDLRIVDVDPSDRTAFAPYYEVYAAALRHGPAGEFATVWQLEEVRIAMADPDERTFRIGWAGWLDDPELGPRVVATGWTQGSTVDNTDLATVLVCCAPGERGHGYAAQMLAHVEKQARARGRDRLVGEVVWPYAGGADGAARPTSRGLAATATSSPWSTCSAGSRFRSRPSGWTPWPPRRRATTRATSCAPSPGPCPTTWWRAGRR
jgi:GNAT superfamily N-acetyltransferase